MDEEVDGRVWLRLWKRTVDKVFCTGGSSFAFNTGGKDTQTARNFAWRGVHPEYSMASIAFFFFFFFWRQLALWQRGGFLAGIFSPRLLLQLLFIILVFFFFRSCFLYVPCFA